MTVNRRLEQWLAHPSALLLAAQLFHVAAWPLLVDSPWGRATLGVIGMVAVAAAVMAVRRTPGVNRVMLYLGAPAMVFTLWEALDPDRDWVVLTSGLLHCPFYLYVSYAMLRYLFHDDKVTGDEYFATAAAFTVVAWAYAYAFTVVQVVWPDSFSSPAGADQSWFELLYLSFSILTSVGLSDIVAVGLQARSVVMLEMMAGVFYIAMVVSRMVGLTMRRR